MWKMCTSPNWLLQDHHRLGNPLGLRGFPNIPGFSYFFFNIQYTRTNWKEESRTATACCFSIPSLLLPPWFFVCLSSPPLQATCIVVLS